jgi:succinoglycan biosynthesis protein ExoA
MPAVSIIIPCYNEQATIRLVLEALYAQTYPRAEMEVVIADGRSSDDTIGQIEQFQRERSDLLVRVVENQARTIPAALNCAIRAAQGRIIVRMDAHSRPYPDYVERCVGALDAGQGLNVGGVWEIHPGGESWIARSIAVAASHPLGVGDARYRLAPTASAVDTVPFGAYFRSLVEQIGYYDESLLSNEDYEFNTRVRQSGGRIWLDPQIRTVYYARSTFRELARQYWRYGYWKWRMLRRYPSTLRWRQALPPLFVLSLIGLILLSIWLPLARGLLALEVIIYLGVFLLAGTLSAFRRKQASLILGLPLAIVTMHLAWGGGFLWSFISSLGVRSKHG